MDWNKIGALFTISKMATEHGPKYAPISQAIEIELKGHVTEAQKIVQDKNKADAEEAGRQRAETANRARMLNDEAQVVEEEAENNVGDATETAPVVRRV